MRTQSRRAFVNRSPHAALQEDVEDIQREVEVLNLISDHENIAELIDSYEDPQHVHLVCYLTVACPESSCSQGHSRGCDIIIYIVLLMCPASSESM